MGVGDLFPIVVKSRRNSLPSIIEIKPECPMRKSVYIETSIISHLMSKPSRNVVTAARQLITQDWWKTQKSSFDAYISAAVAQEFSLGDASAVLGPQIAMGDFQFLSDSVGAQALAKQLIASNGVPSHRIVDALHIALAACCGADYLLTWNFKFINNAMAKPLIQKTVEAGGFTCPTICTPEQLYTGGMEDDAILKELRENRKAIAENRAAQPSPPPSP